MASFVIFIIILASICCIIRGENPNSPCLRPKIKVDTSWVIENMHDYPSSITFTCLYCIGIKSMLNLIFINGTRFWLKDPKVCTYP